MLPYLAKIGFLLETKHSLLLHGRVGLQTVLFLILLICSYYSICLGVMSRHCTSRSYCLYSVSSDSNVTVQWAPFFRLISYIFDFFMYFLFFFGHFRQGLLVIHVAQTYYVDQADLERTDIRLPLPPACYITMPAYLTL